MFVYLIWKNRKGEDLKVLFSEDKALLIAKEMKKYGVNVNVIPEEIQLKTIANITA